MPCEISKHCMSCGGGETLHQCATCKDRLKNTGCGQALCEACIKKPDDLGMFGAIPQDADIGFVCCACIKHLERLEQEKLFQQLKGPSSEKILRTVSERFPWALSIAQASPEELLDALQFCKRKLSGHRTVAALAESLANSNSHAALLIQQMGQNLAGAAQPNASLASRALRTFVKNQCPSIKYKTLLLPPNGSIHKATRHFQDMLKVEDPLVVALAQERLFLCEWAESAYRPVTSEKQRRKGEFPEVPEFALHILRGTLKSLSVKIKSGAAKDQEADMMVKAWYADHISWATTWAMMERSAPTPQLAITAYGEPRQPTLPAHTPKGFGKKGKDQGKNPNWIPKPDKRETLEPPAKHPRTLEPAFGQPSFDSLLTGTPSLDSVDKMYKLYKDQTRQFFLENCRNCFLAGKGQVKHNLYQCQQMGNECLLRCVKCKLGNHWASQCKA
jgi:hypothetical protein